MNFTPPHGNLTVSTSLQFIPRNMLDVLVMLVSVNICFVNATMVHTFTKHHILRQNPRYILFIHLVLNEMIQLAICILLYIFALAFRTIFVFLCALLLLSAILSTRSTPLNLTCMVIECYISVCFPLRYNNMCTVKRTKIVISVIWAISLLCALPDIFILFITEDKQFLTSRAFCERDTVFRSNYSSETRDATHIVFLLVVCVTLIYTFFRIMYVAKATKADVSKARKTLLLHGFQVLLCILVYVEPLISQLFLYFIPNGLSSFRLSNFILIQVLPRFLSPIVYGIRDKTFRKYLRNYWVCLQTSVVPK